LICKNQAGKGGVLNVTKSSDGGIKNAITNA
jgi:hypothetical protein